MMQGNRKFRYNTSSVSCLSRQTTPATAGPVLVCLWLALHRAPENSGVVLEQGSVQAPGSGMCRIASSNRSINCAASVIAHSSRPATSDAVLHADSTRRAASIMLAAALCIVLAASTLLKRPSSHCPFSFPFLVRLERPTLHPGRCFRPGTAVPGKATGCSVGNSILNLSGNPSSCRPSRRPRPSPRSGAQ